MIPFRTSVMTHGSPAVTMSLIVLNIAVFLVQLGLDGMDETRFLYRYALVPAVFTHPEEARAAGLDPSNYLPLISNTFLHGGWLHLIVNMWTLWLFGVPVEDRLGTWRYLLFYLASGTAGSAAHLAFNLNSTVPALGASGAVAGVLGGFAWLFPRAKVAVVIPIIVIPLIINVPALLYTALWFALQVIQGTDSFSFRLDKAGGIAWWAHIGGFIAGVLIVMAIMWRRRRTGPWLPRG